MDKEIQRQLVHLSGAFFVILAQFIPRIHTIAIFVSIALFFFTYSRYVKNSKRSYSVVNVVENKIRSLFLKFERHNVKNPFEGAFYFYAGCAFSFILFPLDIASASSIILAVGDSFSAIIGRLFGKHRIGQRTVEGTLAFVLTAFLASVFFVNPFMALSGAIIGSLVELTSKINDNLTIPLVSGVFMLLVSFF